MEHLFNTRVAVYRLTDSFVNGMSTYTWTAQPAPLNYVACRLDLNFIRVGKDQPMAVEAGKAPERAGVLFYMATVPLLPGDRLQCIPNDLGEMPVTGWFEIRAIPDTAQDAISSHHIEVQVFEVAQALTGVFPGSE